MRVFRISSLIFLLIMLTVQFQSCGGEMSKSFDILSYMDWDVIKEIKPEDFPDDDAIVLLKRKVHLTSIFEGGSETEITRIVSIKILREKGLEDLGTYTSDIYRNGTKYKVEAMVINPDGTKRTVDGENIKKIKIGKNFFQYRIAFPGLEVGSVISLREIESINKVGGLPIVSGEWDFASNYYTLHSELVLKMPDVITMKFAFTPKNSEIKPETSEKREYKIYKFTMDNLPGFNAESFMPREFVNNPTVCYFPYKVTFTFVDQYRGRMYSWTYIAKWKNALKDIIDYFDPESWEKIKEAKEFTDAMNRLIDTMRTEIDTSSLEEVVEYFHSKFDAVENGNFSISSIVPVVVFKDREGEPFGLAYALYRILNELGYKVDIILLRDQDLGEADRRVIDPDQFNHPIVIVRDNENEYAIDPAAKFLGVNQLPWKCQGVKGVEITANRDFFFVTSPVYRCETNLIYRVDTLEVDGGGAIRGRARITLCGQPLYNLWKKAETKDLNGDSDAIRDFVKDVFPVMFSSSDISVSSNRKDSLTIEFSYSADGAFQAVGSLMNMDFSDWFYSPYFSVFSTEKRRYDVLFHYPFVVETSLNVRLPEGYDLFQNVKELSSENDFFLYERRCSVSGSGEELDFKRVFKLLTKKIEVKDYDQAREFINTVKSYDRENIVIKKS